jgi:hypothetical protein
MIVTQMSFRNLNISFLCKLIVFWHFSILFLLRFLILWSYHYRTFVFIIFLFACCHIEIKIDLVFLFILFSW